MKVKVKDIAKAAGVSATAVSLVLNDKPCRLSEATKEHILQVARELHYPNTGIPGHGAWERMRTIGLVLPEEENAFFQAFAAELSRGLFAKGYTLLQSSVGTDLERCCLAIKSLAGANVAGLVAIAPCSCGRETRLIKLLKSLQEGGMPLVLADRAVYSVFCDFVTADHKYGGRLATEYLIGKGHTRIGCILCGQEEYTSRRRLEGYKQALAGAGLPFVKERVFWGAFDEETGRAGAEALIRQGVTGIFAGNDRIAAGVYRHAKERNLQIPAELSVIGYDDTALCGLLSPPLTSIRQDVVRMAEQVTEALLRQCDELASAPKAENYYFTPVLVERGSVGAAAEIGTL